MATVQTTGRFVAGRLELSFTDSILQTITRDDNEIFQFWSNTLEFGNVNLSLRGDDLDTNAGTVESIRWLDARGRELFSIEDTSIPFNGSTLDLLGAENFEEVAFRGDDSFETGAFNDVVRSFGGDDFLNLGGGRDWASGGVGNDTIIGAAGSDTLGGDGGNDFLRAGRGDDVLLGGFGQDTIQGAKGNDSVLGGQGRDIIRLGRDDDLAFGDGGKDTIFGARGDDTIDGDGGDDVITGGSGDDILFGGAGADRFVFRGQTDIDVIGDFNSREGDRIDLRAYNFDDFNDFLNSVETFELLGATGFTLETGTILIAETLPRDIEADFFLF